jgi:hypothetical protein
MPHGAVGQDTVQLTPRFAGSLTTVAASCVVASGSMVFAGALIVSVTCGSLVTPLPPPPHAARAAAASSDKRSAALRWAVVLGGFIAILSRDNPESCAANADVASESGKCAHIILDDRPC